MTENTIKAPGGTGASLFRGLAAAALALVVCVGSSAAGVTDARAAGQGQVIQIKAGSTAKVKIAKGKPQTIRTNAAFYEIVIGDPEIANVNPLTDTSFYVLGNTLGTTGIALFDANRNLVGSVDIEVTLDTDGLARTIRDVAPGSDIKVETANGRVVLSGKAKDAVQAEKAQKVAKRFSGDEEVINSVQLTSSQQVQLNVRFVEMNRNVGQELGAQLGVSYVGPAGAITFNGRTARTSGDSAIDIIGNFASGGFGIDMAIKALEDRGLARRLAEPNLIARSGQKASFLAGGEFPIPVASDNNTVTVDFKKYGVSLEFTPTVLEDGLISLDIAPEVSSVDNSTTYRIGNIAIPGFVVRRANTSVDLKSGQSFMLAGLLQSENVSTSDRVPGLGKLPVLGQLFSSKAYQRRETDLVIIVTPYLVKPIDPSKKVATPIDAEKPMSTADFFLGNVDGMKTSRINNAKIADGRAPVVQSGHFLDLGTMQ
ncbi:secretin [Zhengella mangrovi]|uniref:Secretin n=1 Tax=Zhengella mangrovi TaxID=1982044 RepID=A0A2G1QHY6_9HYPH|nr:type II and III secretion system protein family protein [Zhengella mangrovi]PHP65071.1 secretin [Zhengella mangrovi]